MALGGHRQQQRLAPGGERVAQPRLAREVHDEPRVVVGRGVQLGGRLLQEGEAFADHLIGDVRVVVVVVEDEGVLFLQREGGDGG